MADPASVSADIMRAVSLQALQWGLYGRRRDAYALQFISGAIVALKAAGLLDCAARLATDGAIVIASKDYDGAMAMTSEQQEVISAPD